MPKKFRCRKCGGDTFESFGVIKFANNNFKVMECIKCGNQMFLETKEKVTDKNLKQLDSNSGRLLTKNELKTQGKQ